MSKTFTDEQLRYAADAKCQCGAGMAYVPEEYPGMAYWECSDILTGRAIPNGQPGAVTHSDQMPFAFWEVKSEDQPSANGRTTRPGGPRPKPEPFTATVCTQESIGWPVGDIEKIEITPSEDGWVASRVHRDGVTFFGRGKTPQEALADIDSATKSFNEACFA